MNKRIKELAKQAGVIFSKESYGSKRGVVEVEICDYDSFNIVKFVELITQEYKDNISKVWYEQGMDIRGAELSKFLTQFNTNFELNNDPT